MRNVEETSSKEFGEVSSLPFGNQMLRPFEYDSMSNLMTRKRQIYSMLREFRLERSSYAGIERCCALIELDAINRELANR